MLQFDLLTSRHLCWLPVMSVSLGDGGVKGWRVDRSELKQPLIVLTVEMTTREAAGANGSSEGGGLSVSETFEVWTHLN